MELLSVYHVQFPLCSRASMNAALEVNERTALCSVSSSGTTLSCPAWIP